RMMVVFFALLYALGSMVLGGMLILVRLQGGYSAAIYWGNALGTGSWNYPGLLLVAPWGVLTLPFLATWSMVAVSVGVGIGVSVAILIAVRLVRDRKRNAAQPGTLSAVAGLTPAMIALVTLGACCSVTAAGTAGVGLVAQASGSNLDNLLVNDWYLDVFQVVVVLVALLAQEMILEVYGGLFGLAPEAPGVSDPLRRSSTRGLLAGGALRAGLLLGGVTWSLAMVAEWTTVSPLTATPTLWFQWIFQHQLISALAILVALFPREMFAAFTRPASWWVLAVRVGALLGGLSLIAWVPPSVAAGGAAGFVNELFGVWGLPSAWGAVAPVYAPGAALYVRWGLQYLLLGGFSTACALAPRRAFVPVRWTIDPREPEDGASNASSLGTGDRTPFVPGRPFDPFDGPKVRADPPATARGVRDP
ncbi:MAG: hypothetical protein ACREEC_02790, partial [Thermoplasmata archaeon]